MIQAIALMLITTSAWAANETFQAALEKLYPGCELKKEILYLTNEQANMINQLAGARLPSKLANRFKNCDGAHVYVDSHIVRTLNQTVIIEVNDKKVKSFTVSAFLEPKEYKAPTKWIEQLTNKELDDLALFKQIDGLSGATLTAKANVDAARRVLAIEQALDEKKE